MSSILQMLSSTAGPAVAVALGSAAGFAASNALQHRVAGTVPAGVRHPLAVLAHLARRRVWLVATLSSFTALVLHAVALRLGSIALVQPLMLVGVVLAVPLRAALDRALPTLAEVRAVAVTALGLGVFLLSADPAPSAAQPDLRTAVILVVVGVTGTSLGLRLTRTGFARLAPEAQAAVLGVLAGLMFGLTAGLLKLLGDAVSEGFGGVAPPITVLGLVGAGVLGTALNQRAYQIAPLSFSMPLVNVVDILVALAFGSLVFHEHPGHVPSVLLVQGCALAGVGVGLSLIARLASDRTRGVCPEAGAAR